MTWDEKPLPGARRGLSVERISKETGNAIHFSKTHTLSAGTEKGRRFASPLLFLSPPEPGGISRQQMNPAVSRDAVERLKIKK